MSTVEAAIRLARTIPLGPIDTGLPEITVENRAVYTKGATVVIDRVVHAPIKFVEIKFSLPEAL